MYSISCYNRGEVIIMKIAWIGTGVMGSSMLLHLRDAGHDISAYNRTYEKAAPLQEKGIRVCRDIPTCVHDVDVVCTMVGYPKDVADIYRREDGIFHNIPKGTTLIDMTTSSPQLAKELYQEAKALGASMLDAPVSGGDQGARDATLSIMCGGDQDVFMRCKPLFACMGTSIHYMGEAGSGQHTKACNQIAVAGAVAAMSEALVYATTQGLDAQQVLNAITQGAGGSWQLANMAPRVLQHDFEPGFYIKHFIKDMHIVQTEMEQKNMELAMLQTVCAMYEELAKQGYGDKGTQALIHYYDANS